MTEPKKKGTSKAVALAATPNPAVPEYRRSPKIQPDKHFLRERRTLAIRYRAAGLGLEDIGLRLHADPEINSTGTATPGGYGWRNWLNSKPPLQGVPLANTVGSDIRKAMTAASVLSEEAIEEHVQLEAMRIDKVQAAIWQRCMQGDLWAVDRFIALSARRSKILGLDIDRKEITGKIGVGVFVAEGVQPVMDEEFLAKAKDALAEMGVNYGDVIDAEEVTGDDPGVMAVPQ